MFINNIQINKILTKMYFLKVVIATILVSITESKTYISGPTVYDGEDRVATLFYHTEYENDKS